MLGNYYLLRGRREAFLELPYASHVRWPILMNSLGGMVVNGRGFNLPYHLVVAETARLLLGITGVHAMVLRAFFGGVTVRVEALVLLTPRRKYIWIVLLVVKNVLLLFTFSQSHLLLMIDILTLPLSVGVLLLGLF